MQAKLLKIYQIVTDRKHRKVEYRKIDEIAYYEPPQQGDMIKLKTKVGEPIHVVKYRIYDENGVISAIVVGKRPVFTPKH